MSRVFRFYLVVLTCLLLVAAETQAAKPFRVLVVIGDQWKDPASFMVERAAPTGEYSGYFKYPEVYGENDFHQLMILMKSWGIPFDVVRLDQQFLQESMFTDMYGDPMYGTIIWDVNQGEQTPGSRLFHRAAFGAGTGDRDHSPGRPYQSAGDPGYPGD